MIRRQSRRASAPSREVGAICKNGYLSAQFKGKKYYVHRLVWLYVYGAHPIGDIDHINRVRTDNRLENLREVSHAVNCQNRVVSPDSRSGFMGVSLHKKSGRWRARITVDYQDKWLGYFDTKEEAALAYANEAEKLHVINPAASRRSSWSPDSGPLIYSHTLTSKNGRSVTGHGFTPEGAEEDALQCWMRGEG